MKKRSVGKVLFLEVVVIFVVLMFTIIVTGGEAAVRNMVFMLDFPSALCLLLFVVPALFVSGTAKDFFNAFSIGKTHYTIAQMKKSLEAVKMLQRLVACGASFITVVTFIVVLCNVEDFSNIGPIAATMTITVLYGIILETILVPLSVHVQNYITEAMDLPEEMEFANARIVADNEDEEE
ncbi:MAG: hypothetical protein NC355_04635 [Blautia sp.]|nr:hypothetical protein [Blautia sp.]